jgi:hypothetical protein
MQNAERVKTVLELFGHHGGAVVGQQSAWQRAPH